MIETYSPEDLHAGIARQQSLRFATLRALAKVFIGFAIVVALPTTAIAVEFLEIVEEPVAEQNANLQGFRIENFDQWIFRAQQTLPEAKLQLLNRLKAETDSIQSLCKLTAEQRKELLLAGRGDLNAFVQQYKALRSKFAEVLKNNDQQAMNNLWQELQPLQLKYNSQIYGEDSLFAKVLDHVLDKQQFARIEHLRREQRSFEYRAAVMQMISQLDQVAPLTHEQRERLLDLIDQYTSPPKSRIGDMRRQLLTYYVLGQMAEIPEDELRPLFGKAGWKLLSQQIQQGKAMKRNLEQQGLVPE